MHNNLFLGFHARTESKQTCSQELAVLKQYSPNNVAVLVRYANQYDRVREESQGIDQWF